MEVAYHRYAHRTLQVTVAVCINYLFIKVLKRQISTTTLLTVRSEIEDDQWRLNLRLKVNLPPGTGLIQLGVDCQ